MAASKGSTRRSPAERKVQRAIARLDKALKRIPDKALEQEIRSALALLHAAHEELYRSSAGLLRWDA